MNQMPKSPAIVSNAEALCSRAADGEVRFADGGKDAVSWQLPEEVPVALQLNSEAYDARRFARLRYWFCLG
jgi:FdhD protein